ncbi:papilin isoform X1 [Oryzias latipes]|uniref:Papilin b, proteoglycan-like sulfated glycoprotein n=1 Tax=Oryzias latipes TaxID=8090 RepID=H2MCZ1_ORYLA|nr:papilin isoform X1 [Oryzias latipes]XP_020570258.1 papilin isoform X1 [Oryzias latipes]
MNILQVLGLLHLLTIPALTLNTPVYDYWGEFGAFGPCSRTCGTGVAMRTRKCITSRTDGGHNCVGSSKSYRTCSTQPCPVGLKDFREVQCSEFDTVDYHGNRLSWVPHYEASNPCEVNCVPSGQNVFYRTQHRLQVTDGTPCNEGHTDICVEGVCRALTHEEFMGLDNDTETLHFTLPSVPHLRETHPCTYRTGLYSECSASCNGGLQYRSVECVIEDPVHPRVVDESYCIIQHLHKPLSQKSCNMHSCGEHRAEYSVSSFSVCSVTCGEGQQTREVVCVGPRGERLPDHACSGLVPPASVQACRRPACYTQITWHVTEFGLCSRSCSGGVRERQVSCFDTDLHPYPEEQCGLGSKPSSVESCNTQSCHEPQTVPSFQNPSAIESTFEGYVPHVLEEHLEDCVHSRYGCCLDGVTLAQGFGRAGCPEYQTVSDVSFHPESVVVDYDSNSVHSTYVYRTGVYSECSASCNGGVQHRRVECVFQDLSNPEVVDESYCTTQHLQKPQVQQECNVIPCVEYSVSSFSECSVTCGEGHQMREVICVGPRGEHLSDRACRGLVRPASVQACRRPACYTQITWHVTEYELCSRSCGGGVRERQVSCFDTDLHPYSEDQCGLESKPNSVESCNTQPCHEAQSVPSVQDPGTEEGTTRRFVPHVPEESPTPSPDTNNADDLEPAVTDPDCAQSVHGCCPDGYSTATGPENDGCPTEDCSFSRFGCCKDGVTAAEGDGQLGCPEHQTAEEHPPVPVDHASACSLPRDEGPCEKWVARFAYDAAVGKCKEFWYGGCHGNANNFASEHDCQKQCGASRTVPVPVRRRWIYRRGFLRSVRVRPNHVGVYYRA